MPPKKRKTVKAITAEIKKKNTKEAKEITPMLKQKGIHVQDISSDSETTGEVNSAANETCSINFTKIGSVHLTETGCPAAVSAMQNIATSSTSSKKIDKSNSTETRSEGKKTDEANNEVIPDLERHSRKGNRVQSMASTSKNVDCTVKPSTKKLTENSGSSTAAFYYEIDCKRVSDSIKATDLKKHLEKQLKVNGEKNNLGDNITVCCREHTVINIDFEIQYGKKTQLFELWPSFVEKSRFRILEIKDPSSKKFATNLKKNLSEDGVNIILCHLLSSMILPTFKKNVAKKDKPKDMWKPSILESRKAFIEHAQNSIQMEKLLQDRKELVIEKGLNFQPMVIVLGGEEIFEGRYFYVCYDAIMQKFTHFVEAVDFAFKLTRIFNLKYSEDCQQIWTFFQIYFYKIRCDGPISPSVDNFIRSLDE